MATIKEVAKAAGGISHDGLAGGPRDGRGT